MVIGRNKEENEKLQDIENEKFIHIKTVGFPGPHTLLSKNASEADHEFAARAILTYCKTSPEEDYTLDFEGENVEVKPLESRERAAAYSLL